MTWVAPRTWVAGEVVTAAYMNSNVRDNTIDLDTRATAATAAVATLNAGAWVKIAEDLTETTINSLGYTTLKTLTPSPAATPATSEILILIPFRKTAGAAASASILVTVTTSGGTGSGGLSPVTDAVNLAGSGLMIIRFPPRYTNYVNSGMMSSVFTGSTQVTGQTTAAQRASGTLTNVIIQGLVGSASISLGIQGVKVYAIP